MYFVSCALGLCVCYVCLCAILSHCYSPIRCYTSFHSFLPDFGLVLVRASSAVMASLSFAAFFSLSPSLPSRSYGARLSVCSTGGGKRKKNLRQCHHEVNTN